MSDNGNLDEEERSALHLIVDTMISSFNRRPFEHRKSIANAVWAFCLSLWNLPPHPIENLSATEQVDTDEVDTDDTAPDI